MLFVAGDATLDFLGGIVLAAMENGVGQRLAQRRFDLKFLARAQSMRRAISMMPSTTGLTAVGRR